MPSLGPERQTLRRGAGPDGQPLRGGASNLVELKDFGRVPLWLVEKPLYAVLPMWVFLRIASARGTFDSMIFGRRQRVLENLERHLGTERNHDELRLIARQYLQFRWRVRLARLWPQVRQFAGAEEIPIEGLKHLDRAVDRGMGVILASAHYGHARLIKPILRAHGRRALLVGLARESRRGPQDLPPYFSRIGDLVHNRLLRLPRASTLDERWNRTVGTDLATGINLREHFRALARNETLIVLSDGRAAHAGRVVSVLGIEVWFASGAVGLARTAGAALLPTFVVDDRESGGPSGLRLIIRPPLDIQRTDDANADLEVNLSRFAAAYEGIARAYPHNWHWSWVRNGVFGNPLL